MSRYDDMPTLETEDAIHRFAIDAKVGDAAEYICPPHRGVPRAALTVAERCKLAAWEMARDTSLVTLFKRRVKGRIQAIIVRMPPPRRERR